MLTWRFAVQFNRSLVELVGLVIEKTEVVFFKSFPCVVVKRTFQATCGVASFQMQKMKLIWFCREPASSRRRKISMTWQFAPLVDQISVLGGVVVPIPGVGCQKKCPATVKVGSIDDLTIRPTHRSNLGRFQKTIGGLAIISECSALTDNTQGIWKIHTTWLQ